VSRAVSRVLLAALWVGLLASPRAAEAGHGRVTVLACIDGVPGTEYAGLPTCDGDGAANAVCLFELPSRSGMPRPVRVRAGRTRRVHLPRGARLLLECLTGAEPAVQKLTCTDGALAGVLLSGWPAQVCDFDRACDGICSFAFPCPLCVYGDPGCLVACHECPAAVDATVPVGSTKALFLPSVRKTVLLECAAGPARASCRSATTTTTMPPDCTSDADCLRYPEPCRTCMEARCGDPSQPPVVCLPRTTTTTLAPLVCRNDMDCERSDGFPAGCTTFDGCGYCTR
jgi:hypothetical protein